MANPRVDEKERAQVGQMEGGVWAISGAALLQTGEDEGKCATRGAANPRFRQVRGDTSGLRRRNAKLKKGMAGGVGNVAEGSHFPR